MKKIQYLTVVLCLLFSSGVDAQQWSPHGTGRFFNPYLPTGGGGYPSAMLSTDSILYLTGSFTKYITPTDTIITNQIGKWNGTQLFPIGGGVLADMYSDMIYYKGKLYTAGPSGNCVWDGVQWEWNMTGSGGGTINAGKVFLNYHDTLFIGGNMYIDSNGWQDMVGWDGTDWLYVGYVPSVCDMVVYKDTIYTSSYYGLYKRTGPTQWEQLNGIGQLTLEVDTFNNFLYATCGLDIYYNGENLHNIIYYDGHSWHSAGQGIDSVYTNDFIFYHGYLYVGGNWMDAYNPRWMPLYRLEDTAWTTVSGAIFYDGIYNMAVFQDDLYLSTGYSVFDADTTDTIYDLVRLHMPPDTDCHYLQPRAFVDEDTVFLSSGTVQVAFENNNNYADSWSWNFDDGGTSAVQNPLHIFTDTGTYDVSVTVAHQGCVKTAGVQVTVLQNTDIHGPPLSVSEFKIYPNPTKHNFTIEITMPQDGQFVVYSPSGELMQQLKLKRGKNRAVVSTAGWQPATYICNLMVGNKFVGSKKLILSR